MKKGKSEQSSKPEESTAGNGNLQEQNLHVASDGDKPVVSQKNLANNSIDNSSLFSKLNRGIY